MITQTIARWFNKLFAWWPWRRSSIEYPPQPTGSGNKGMTQEHLWRTTVDGPIPQPGITSVAVEQEVNEGIPESSRSGSDERVERPSPSSPAKVGEISPPFRPSPDSMSKDPNTSSGTVPLSSPTYEQQLAFLQYLVKKGIVNEGFNAGQVPDQYRRKE